MRQLFFATLALIGLSGAVQACPTYSMPGVEQYQFTGNELYSPRTFSVVAGGESSIGKCPITPLTDRGPGHFATQADFSFYVTGMQPYELHIQVGGDCDTVLLINTGSTGWYYDDDDDGYGGGLITLSNPANGRIDVWAGTYDGGYCDATIKLETF